MQHRRYWLLVGVAFGVLLLGARACGPDFGSAVFVVPDNPDNLTMFLDGRLAILQPGFHTRHLVAAYRYLSGLPLSVEEKKAFVAANEHYVDPLSDTRDVFSDKPSTALAAWIAARTGFGAVDGYVPDATLATDRQAPGQVYDTFANCLDPAFATAAATLTKRVRGYGSKDAGVVEWVRGQDAVFSNCGDGKAAAFFGPGKPPPPPPAPHLPKSAVASEPVWLRQDRAYQMAAAQFYAMKFEAAVADFRAIAGDTGSAWAVTSRYMVARVLIRESTLLPLPNPAGNHGAPMTDAQQAADRQTAQQKYKAAQAKAAEFLRQAQAELVAMRGEARMAPLYGAIDDLTDYVDIRLDPQRDAVTLAKRFLEPGNPRLKQSLIDFTVLHTSAEQGNDIAAITNPVPAVDTKRVGKTDTAAEDLIAWVETVNSATPANFESTRVPDAHASDKAFVHWESGHSTAWLVAALMLTAKPDGHTAALLAAAKAVRPSDAAYLTVAYHRLRLSPRDAATRAEVLPLLAMAERGQGRGQGTSAVNALKQVATATAPTLADWLVTAGRVPAGDTGYDDMDTVPYTMPKEDVCGRAPVGFALFDTDAAVALNQQMPLRLLAEAAEAATLPENLRYQVAQATWVRAVLLDEPAMAKRMSPILEACRAAWKPVLDAYDAASTPTDRKALGLLALMRFASTEPSVREADERRQGFASYDELRQNWWCSTVPLPMGTVDDLPAAWFPGRNAGTPSGDDPSGLVMHLHPVPVPPTFLTAADLREAAVQVAALRAVPNASTYFAKEALAWIQVHPADARNADILGEADRVLRNSCRHDPPYGKAAGPENTATLAHAVFDALHGRYPESVWAKRYKTWE